MFGQMSKVHVHHGHVWAHVTLLVPLCDAPHTIAYVWAREPVSCRCEYCTPLPMFGQMFGTVRVLSLSFDDVCHLPTTNEMKNAKIDCERKLEKANGDMLCADVIVLVPLW